MSPTGMHVLGQKGASSLVGNNILLEYLQSPVHIRTG